MAGNSNPFEGSIDALREAGERETNAPQRQPHSKRKVGFIITSADWLKVLRQARPPVNGATIMVAWHLIELWRRHGRTVGLGNKVLKTHGVGRRRKSEALQRLAGLGLVECSQEGKRATRVTWLVDPNG
jgi:hypothetical protein